MDEPHSELAIKVEGVSKTFRLPHERVSSVKSLLISAFRGKRSYELQKALKDVSFEIKKGEFFGIVGRNGSGKSTLLKMLAGIYVPTSGQITINGKLTPFIELGVGFNPELTGRENVYLNGALLGFNRKEMRAMYDEIVAFAELSRFMDQKLKNYSSGMQVRLAFSIAIRAKTDILLIDEVLAVGDAAFQAKCLNYFADVKSSDTTVVFVSHDMESVRRFCDRVILIDNGKKITGGSTTEAVDEYLKLMTIRNSNDKPFGVGTVTTREGIAEIKKAWFEFAVGEADGKKITSINDEKKFFACLSFEALQDVNNPVPGVLLRNREGLRVIAANTAWEGTKLGVVKKGQHKTVKFELPNMLERGQYYLSVNVVSENMEDFYHWRNDIAELSCTKAEFTGGVINPSYKVSVS